MKTAEPGQFVLYYHQNLLHTGIVTASGEGKITILSRNKAIIQLPLSRAILISIAGNGKDDPNLALEHFCLLIDQFCDRFSPHDLVKGVEAMGDGTEFDIIASQSGYILDYERFALYIFLVSRNDYFSHKNGLFKVLSRKERQTKIQHRQQELERKSFLDKASQLFKGILDGEIKSVQTDKFTHGVMQALQNSLIDHQQTDLVKVLQKISPERTLPGKIWRIRRVCKDITDDTDVQTAASGLPVAFHDEYHSQARIFNYRDLTHLEAFSIDDPSTRDFDDAFTWEESKSGYNFGIHIALVSSVITKEGALFEIAADRISSMYLPNEEIPMLPPRQAHDELCLRKGNERLVLSLLVELDQEMRVLATEFDICRIRIYQNLSYQEVDRKSLSSPFSQMLHLKSVLFQQRKSADENNGNRYQYQLFVENGRVRMRCLDRLSPARMMVEEFMIFYNMSFAKLAMDNDIPLIHRNIETRFLSENDLEAPDTYKDKTMHSAFLSTQAGFHPGIGTQAYVHSTSPIRRFADLLNQMQIMAYLTYESCPFSTEDLESYIVRIATRLMQQKELYAETDRFWFLKYIEQNQLGTPLSAYILKKTKHGILAEIDQWQRKAILKTDARVASFSEVLILVNRVDWESRSLIVDVLD